MRHASQLTHECKDGQNNSTRPHFLHNKQKLLCDPHLSLSALQPLSLKMSLKARTSTLLLQLRRQNKIHNNANTHRAKFINNHSMKCVTSEIRQQKKMFTFCTLLYNKYKAVNLLRAHMQPCSSHLPACLRIVTFQNKSLPPHYSFNGKYFHTFYLS